MPPQKLETETCANCDAKIGRLETPFLFKGQTVCALCYRKLAPPDGGGGRREKQELLEGIADELDATPDRTEKKVAPILAAWEMVCPSCSRCVTPRFRQLGSVGTLIVLYLIGIIPGLLYGIFVYRPEYSCPHCKTILKPSAEIAKAAARRSRI